MVRGRSTDSRSMPCAMVARVVEGQAPGGWGLLRDLRSVMRYELSFVASHGEV